MVRYSFFDVILFAFFSTGVTGQYDNCTGQIYTINDGRCDMENNVAECGYDGGDCCECSCMNDRLYPCGISGFNCSDPDMLGSAGSCQSKTASFSLCLTNGPQTWLVEDTASAKSLAEVVNCSGGTFYVAWRGSVLLSHTIHVPDGTTLYVTGEGPGAEVDGGGKTRLFMAVGAELHIEGLILSNGNATFGGAIAATCSRVFLNQTLFSGNIASSLGGAIYVGMGSTLAGEGQTMLTGNHAGQDGGGVAVSVNSTASWSRTKKLSLDSAVGDDSFGDATYVHDRSSALWYEVMSFVNNTAGTGGGALSVFGNSTASWHQETSFVDNTADVCGGVMLVMDSSNVFWDGVTSFDSNSAQYGGALSVLDNSNVWWDGETSFVDNTADFSGGALSVLDNSNVWWGGETSFVDNTADFSGGAIFVRYNSNVLWDGATSYVINSAHYGGALSVLDNSNVWWDGETFFVDNTADFSGGAMYCNVSYSLMVGGKTLFVDNEAGIDGGAAYIFNGVDNTISPYFILDSPVLFHGNTCGGNGGAIAFVGEVVTHFSPNVTFSENTAGLYGGAIYMSGVTVGMVYESTIFLSNSAAIGGGLYSTDNMKILIGCEFIGNEARRTGGAMDSSEGKDVIVNTSFVRNSALIGGALSLVGTTSLTRCEFIENSANGNEGPAISNDGVISPISHCSFIDNTFNCEPGYYLDFNHTNVLFDNICKGCNTQCSECIIEGMEPTICIEALEHSTSLGVRATLESLSIDPGYWRATTTSVFIFACYTPKACLGGLTGDVAYCLKGYEGPYCSVCSTGYIRSLGFFCNKCSYNATGGFALAVVMAIVFLLALIAFLSYMLSGKMEDADQGIVARLTRFIPLQSVKIVIVVWQILTQFSTVANAVFPSVYQRFLDGVDILNFDLSWMVSAWCIIETDFHDQLLVATLGPLVCMGILGGTYMAAMHSSCTLEGARVIVRRKHLSMVLLLTFLIYSSVSLTLFKTFACDKLDDGNIYLRADYRIECDSSKHKALEIYAGFMIVLYVIGIPAFYGVLLYINREALMNFTDREEDELIKPIIDLWRPYRPDRSFYELIECARRVLLTGALVFIYPNTAAQIAVALMMATFFIFVSEALAPYASPWDTWCSRTGHAIVFTSMFLALLLKVDVSREQAKSQMVFEWVLVAVHSCLIVVVLIEAIAMVMAWRKEVKEDSKPRIRPRLSVLSPSVGRGRAVLEDEPPLSFD